MGRSDQLILWRWWWWLKRVVGLRQADRGPHAAARALRKPVQEIERDVRALVYKRRKLRLWVFGCRLYLYVYVCALNYCGDCGDGR